MAEVKPNLVTLEELEFEDPIPVPANLRRPIAVRPMVLMGTGPTNPSKRVVEALCKPTMGIYTPEFHQVFHKSRTSVESICSVTAVQQLLLLLHFSLDVLFSAQIRFPI